MNYPDDWEMKELKQVGEWHTGSTPRRSNSEYWDGSILWVSPKDMKTDRITDTEDKMTQKALDETNSQVFPEGSLIVVTRSGILEHSLPVAINEKPVAINQDLKAFTASEEILSEFLYYYLIANENEILRECSKDGTTVASINSDSFYSYKVPIPPLEEQKEIINKIKKLLSQVDAGIESLEVVSEKTENYRASLLDSAIKGNLTSKWRQEKAVSIESSLDKISDEKEKMGESPLNYKNLNDNSGELNIPDSWVSISMEHLIYSTRYGTSEKCDYEYTGPPVLRIPNIRDGRLELDDMKYANSDSELDNIDPLSTGDFLVIRTNGSEDLIGRGALVEREFKEPHYFASYLIRFRILPVEPLPEWINLVWQSHYIRKNVLDKAASSAGQYNLSQSKILDFEIPLPPFREQKEIIDQVEKNLTVTDTIRTQIDENKQRASMLRQAILNKAFEGGLVELRADWNQSKRRQTSEDRTKNKNTDLKQQTLPEIIEGGSE